MEQITGENRIEQITRETFPEVFRIRERHETEDKRWVNINEFFGPFPIFSIEEPSKERIFNVLRKKIEELGLKWPRSPAYMLSDFKIGVYSTTLLNLYYNP